MIFACTEFGVDFRFSGSARILAGCTSDFRRAQRAGNFFGVVFINTGGVVYVCEMTCVIYLPHIVLGIGLRVGLLHGDVAAAPGWQARRARSARGERADCRRGPFEVGEVAHNDILLVHVRKRRHRQDRADGLLLVQVCRVNRVVLELC